MHQAVKGTKDFGPGEAARYTTLTNAAREICARFGYDEIMLPILESGAVFRKGIGETTDIIERQMFTLAGKDDVILRPEGTAQVVRFFLENSLHKQADFYKLFYIGAMFRGERPQKGRLRQFHQIGAEIFGSPTARIDGETILLADTLLHTLGIQEKTLIVNSLGCARDKEAIANSLKKALTEQHAHLCPDCQRRLAINPLRVLDCKNTRCKEIASTAHAPHQNLCDECRAHFDTVLAYLHAAGIRYTHDTSLVRGLDYYTRTVFEFTSSQLGSQDAIGAGGRYDTLIPQLGGPDIPAIGFALGIERIILALQEPPVQQPLDIFLATTHTSLCNNAQAILHDVRAAGMRADMDYCDKSIKSQFRYATRRNAAWVAVIGEDELRDNCVMLKHMATSTQEKVPLEGLIEKIRKT